MTDLFYKAFEDKYRGSRDLIKSRLQVYLPFVTPLLDKTTDSNHIALDLGCGRGEWLELLLEQGFLAKGVDLDEGMLESCEQLNLSVEKADAVEYLLAQNDDSADVISGFHIAEHIAFEKLQELVKQSLRVLKPGGLLILETPNAENIVVGTSNFYLDPTHQKPLPPKLLSFIAEYAGYARVKVLRLQEPEGLLDSEEISLFDVLSGVSPDYSVVAQKEGAKDKLKKFDRAFSQEIGVSLDRIADSYESQLNSKRNSFQSKFESEMQNVGRILEQIELANKEILNKNAEFDETKKRVNQLISELVVVKEEKSKIESTRALLLQQLDVVNKENSALKSEFKEKTDEMQRRVERLIIDLGNIKEEKSTSEATNKTLLQQLDDVKKEKIDLEHKVEAKLELERDKTKETLVHLGKLKNKYDVTQASNSQLVQQVYELELKINEFADKNHNLTIHIETVNRKIEEDNKRIDEIEHWSHHWWQQTEKLKQELNAVYKSKSWRLTWPLRKSLRIIKWMLLLPGRLILWIIRLPKRLARRILVGVIKFVTNRPSLRSKLILRLNHYPGFKIRLKSFLEKNGINLNALNYSAFGDSVLGEVEIHDNDTQLLNDDNNHMSKQKEFRCDSDDLRLTDGKNYDDKSPLEKWFS